MIVEITIAELRDRNACDHGYAFAAGLADATGVVRLDMSSPLAWVWLESGTRAWASWLGLRAPNLYCANLVGADLSGADLGSWERGPDGYARRVSP